MACFPIKTRDQPGDKTRLAIVVVMIAMAGWGCKNSEVGSFKTLDNLEALGPLEFTQCAGNFPLHPKASELKFPTHLKAAIQAVPVNLQNSFFDDLKGSIELHDDLAGVCWPDPAQRPQREDDVTGCVRQYGDATRPLVIHLLASKHDTTESHNKQSYALLLRFGFIWADQVQSRHITASGPVTFYGVTDGPIGSIQNQLTLAFLDDVAARGSAGARAIAAFGIPEQVTLAATPALRERLWNGLPMALRNDFTTRVAAESFHSYFCSDTTRSSMANRYRSTDQIFSEMARDMLGQTKIADVKASGTISATRSGWYDTYGKSATMRLANGQDVGSAARVAVARDIENSLGIGSSRQFQTSQTGFQLFDLQQMLPFLFQALNGLMSGSGFDPMSFMNQLLGGLGGNVFPNPGGNIVPTPNPTQPTTPNQVTPLPTPTPSIIPNPTTPSAGGDGMNDIDPEARIAFEEGNKYRQQHGLPPHQFSRVIYDECVAQAQAQVSQGMKHWLVPHPNSNAENIASGQRNGVSVASAWYNSPGHKANLLGRYKTSAVGRAQNQWCHRFK